MENISIPLNYVAIRLEGYAGMIEDSNNLARLKAAAFAGIFWRRYAYDNHIEADYKIEPIIDALRMLFPDEYKATVEAAKEAFLAAEAKGEEE